MEMSVLYGDQWEAWTISVGGFNLWLFEVSLFTWIRRQRGKVRKVSGFCGEIEKMAANTFEEPSARTSEVRF